MRELLAWVSVNWPVPATHEVVAASLAASLVVGIRKIVEVGTTAAFATAVVVAFAVSVNVPEVETPMKLLVPIASSCKYPRIW